MLAGKARALLVLFLLAGCSRLTADAYQQKLRPHLTTFADGEVSVKQGGLGG